MIGCREETPKFHDSEIGRPCFTTQAAEKLPHRGPIVGRSVIMVTRASPLNAFLPVKNEMRSVQTLYGVSVRNVTLMSFQLYHSMGTDPAGSSFPHKLYSYEGDPDGDPSMIVKSN